MVKIGKKGGVIEAIESKKYLTPELPFDPSDTKEIDHKYGVVVYTDKLGRKYLYNEKYGKHGKLYISNPYRNPFGVPDETAELFGLPVGAYSRDESKDKAELERLDWERMPAEAKAKAEIERRELTSKLQATSLGVQVKLALTDAVQQLFFVVPAGSFTMGSSGKEEGRSSDEWQFEVRLIQPFWLAKTEVTQAQWEAVMGSNPSHFKGEQLPVENVSWKDTQAFITKLNDKQILPEGWKFALPTEEQWEYACRAGEKGPYSGGSLEEVGWYDGNSGSKTHEVGQKKPNAWGLHDMHGNVYEWCADLYADTLQGEGDQKVPESGGYRVRRGVEELEKYGPNGYVPESGSYRVYRGGAWPFSASLCRAACRIRSSNGDYSAHFLGFRPALVPSR